MSCPGFTFTPHGREGIGVCQPQSGIDYPFVAPSDDIRFLVADLHVAFDDPAVSVAGTAERNTPYRVKYLYNVGCNPNALPAGAPTPRGAEADIVIVDINNNTVFDTTAAAEVDYTKTQWNTDYTLYKWTISTGTCQLVAHTNWKTGEPAPRHYDRYIAPENGTLDARAVYKLPKRLLSLRVKQRSGTEVFGPYIGNVVFKNGYNTEIVTTPSTANYLKNTEVRLSAVAGSGAGYYPVCGDGFDQSTGQPTPQPIRTINGAAANAAGDFLLSASDCLYLRRPTVRPTADILYPDPVHQQQMGADCPPCCECDDYVATALYMNSVSSRYQLIGTRVENIKDIHELNIDRWLDKRDCALAKPLKLIFVPQGCPFMDVVAMICNPCGSCLSGSTLQLTLTPVNPPSAVTAELVCGYTALFAPGISGQSVGIDVVTSNSITTATFKMPSINSGASAYLKFRLKFSPRLNFAVKGTLTGTLDAPAGMPLKTGCDNETPEVDRIVAVAEMTRALYCDDNGDTDMPC
jgi:hypothetical protein